MARKHTDTPPYVPKKGLVEVMEQIQGHKEGDLIERDELHKRGVSAHLIYPAMAALRFLGLLDQSDHLIGKHRIFGRENPDRDAQKAVIESAYCDFFENSTLPFENYDALKNHFQEVYGLSERLMNSSFPLFEYLATDAGIALCKSNPSERDDSQGSGGVRKGEAEEHHNSLTISKGDSGAADEDTIAKSKHGGGVQVLVTIQVTKYTNEKDIMRMVKTAKRAVHLLKKSGESHY